MLREKVTKLAKIMFTGLTMALCVTALNPAVTAKAEDMLQESEPNDNPATANQIPLNTWVRGEVGYQKEDWYQFTLKEKGETNISIKLDDGNANADSKWGIILYDAKRRTLCEWYTGSRPSGTISWTPGKYYIKIVGIYDSEGSYNFAVYNKASNTWEQERYYGDKAISNANMMSLNKQYTGKLYCGNDVDYYRLKLKGLNGVSFKFTIDDTVSEPGTWYVEFIEYKSRKVLESYGISTNETLQIPRCSGDLLVKISTNPYESAAGDVYHISATSKLSATEITSLNGGTRSANLRWKKVSNATGYYIYRSTSENGYYKKVATVKGKTSYTDKKSLKKSGYYYYKIVAYRKSGSKTLKSAPTSASYTYVY